MMLYKDESIIIQLKSFGSCNYDNVACWVKYEEKYNVHVFTAVVNDEEQLSQIWLSLVDDVAIHFQSLLKSNVEIWNIYIVFFVNKMISVNLKYCIEQNKYSSRKIVVDDLYPKIMSDAVIEENLLQKLFVFRTTTSEFHNSKYNLESILNRISSNMSSTLKKNLDKSELIQDFMGGSY